MPRRKKNQARDSIVKKKDKLRKLFVDRTTILAQYNNDLDQLKSNDRIYKRTKHPDYKQSSSLYRKYLRINNQIEKLHTELCAALGTDFNIDQESEEAVILKCENCHRRVIDNCDSFYAIDLKPISSNTVIHKSRIRFVRSTRRNTEPVQYQVCEQCKEHLTNRSIDVAMEPKNMWPAFIWNMLQSTEIQENYNSDQIWKHIPKQWRRWWMEELHSQFPAFYRNITISEPIPIFVDRTNDIKIWNDGIDSGKLMTIADVCNKYLLPTVLCPWGCSEFIHKAGYLDFHIVIQRYISKVILFDIDYAEIAKVDPARDDFCRDSYFDYNVWLWNPKWRVLPTIVMIENTPYVLTCNDHNGGDTLLQVHCCRWKSNLPAPISDQLCHAVMKSRTVKNVKAGYSSIGYQMVEQRMSFKGPDSINIRSVGRTDHNSVLLHEAEARSYANRPDMKFLVQRLIADGKMSQDHADGIREFSQHFSSKEDYESLKEGSSYVPLEIAMMMKKEARNRSITGIIDDDDEIDEEYTRKFKRMWPLYLYPCQKMNSYGARLHCCPSYNVSGSKMLWLVSSLLLHIETLWGIVSQGEMRRSQWQGHVLVYLTKNCIPYLNRRAVGIFKHLTMTKLSEMILDVPLCKSFFLFFVMQQYNHHISSYIILLF